MQYMFQLPGLKELRSHASDGQCRLVGRLLLQIHDELMVEVEETCQHWWNIIW